MGFLGCTCPHLALLLYDHIIHTAQIRAAIRHTAIYLLATMHDHRAIVRRPAPDTWSKHGSPTGGDRAQPYVAHRATFTATAQQRNGSGATLSPGGPNPARTPPRPATQHCERQPQACRRRHRHGRRLDWATKIVTWPRPQPYDTATPCGPPTLWHHLLGWLRVGPRGPTRASIRYWAGSAMPDLLRIPFSHPCVCRSVCRCQPGGPVARLEPTLRPRPPCSVHAC